MIQLRVRTEYSFGQTFAPVSRVIERLKALGCTAAGIVDVGSTWGHVEWFGACQKAGIRPLLGVELVVSDNDLTHRMWFLAKNQAGLSELYRWSSQAYKQTISTRAGSTPRLYSQDVRDMSADIFKFAGDNVDGAFLAEIGAIVDFNPASRVLTAKKRRIVDEFGLRWVGTSDNAFSAPEDRQVFELVSNGGLKPTPQHLLEVLDGQETAEEVAAQCEGLTLPKAPMVRAEGDLEAICREGIAFRGMQWNDEYEARLQYELELIRSKDFESYFIVVADMCRFAKKHMLVGPSRGSAAGSLVCYAARITEIDPIPPKLYFERFIDVSRSDLPDIDLDFPDSKREMVFTYMAEKYGAANVAHIGTISRFKPKSALIQVCKALGIPSTATAAVKVAMIVRSSADSRANNCLEDTLLTTKPGRDFMEAYPQAASASLIEGHASHTGVHAAGLLVCNDEITNYCTVDNHGIAHVEKGAAETLGLLKIDVLGLRTLGVLEDSGVEVDWYNLPFTDPKTYEVFNANRFCGIFQFEGNALRAIARDIDFKSLVEIDAVTALARPGPFGSGVTERYVRRKNGEPYEAMHPLVESYMTETFGLPVYQEQTLAIVREIGKFDWKETSTIRKAMSKRMGKEFFDTYWEKFKAGAASQGISEKEARATWESINAMGAWQMNKCASGKTLVRITANNTGLPAWVSLAELYDKYVTNPSAWIRQNKSMPRLLSLFPDGRGRPQRAKAIYKSGVKRCVRLVFDDGSSTECTAEHKFLIDENWSPCGEAEIGSLFTCLQRDHSWKNTSSPTGKHNGRHVAIKEVKASRTGTECDDCGKKKKRMEVHHNDHAKGTKRPRDLAWLCSSCHKLRHKAAGDWDVPFDRGHEVFTKTLIAIEDAGDQETYDIEMPEHHNFVVDGGLVTHNSHTYSYAVISYWTAWLKANHPLEFAACNLRNAKDEESAVLLLREMVKEGIQFSPFDIRTSRENWSVQEGRLVGGFLNLKGFGAKKSEKFVKLRDEGKLTAKQIDEASRAPNIFSDIFPFRTKYGAMYDDPGGAGIAGPLVKIEEIEEGIRHDDTRVFLGTIVYKNARNANEEINVKKRGGKLETGPLEFLDLRLRDDTGTIGARIGRRDFEAIGRHVLESVPVGSELMVRAKFFNGIRFAFITKYKVLWQPGEAAKKKAA